jgi:putative transposase
MRVSNIRAAHGYRIRRQSGAKPSAQIPNILKRQFDVSTPNRAWVTREGWLYLAVGLELFSRKVIGWATKPTLGREFAIDDV